MWPSLSLSPFPRGGHGAENEQTNPDGQELFFLRSRAEGWVPELESVRGWRALNHQAALQSSGWILAALGGVGGGALGTSVSGSRSFKEL